MTTIAAHKRLFEVNNPKITGSSQQELIPTTPSISSSGADVMPANSMQATIAAELRANTAEKRQQQWVEKTSQLNQQLVVLSGQCAGLKEQLAATQAQLAVERQHFERQIADKDAVIASFAD